MRRGVLAVLVVALTGMAAGVTYDTVLYTDDLNDDLQMTGEVWPEYHPDSVDIVLTYSFSLNTDTYNGTKITGFDVAVRNASGVVLRHEVDISGLDIEGNDSVDGYTDFNAPVPPEDVTEMGLLVNHTAVLPDGTEVERQLEGSIDPELSPPNRTIDSLVTNTTSVYRDQEFFIEGNASNLVELTIGETTLAVEGSRFSGWIPVPDGLEAGYQDVQLTITSSSDHEFRRTVSFEVLNRPPLLNLSVPANVSRGDEFDVGFEASDDTGIREYQVRVGNETYNASSSPVTVSTENLSVGRHNVTGVVVDDDGALTGDVGAVEVVETADADDQMNEDEANGDGQQNTTETDDGGETSRLPVIGAIRDFITNLIRSILG